MKQDFDLCVNIYIYIYFFRPTIEFHSKMVKLSVLLWKIALSDFIQH